MKGYKGFDKGLVCRGKQYAENTVFEEDKAVICSSGMHFCENPFDVLDHYGFVNGNAEINDFAEVEALDEVKTDDNKKYCTKKLRVGTEIGIPGLVKAFVEFTKSKVDFENAAATNTGDMSAATNTGYMSAATNTGYMSAATNTGYMSAATNTGDYSAATNTGNKSSATNTGDYSAATNTGYMSAATNTGYMSAATNTGNKSAATNTGDMSAATTTGYMSAATNTGNYSAASVEGKDSFAIATGIEGKAKGALGCYIAVAEWVREGYEWKLKGFKTHKVDGKRIKANVYYQLKNGKFVEAE